MGWRGGRGGRWLAGHENAKKRKLKQTQKTGENDAWWNWCKAYGRHDTWRNWEHSHNRTHSHAHRYSVHTQRWRGNWQYLRNYISCGRRHTTTGKICNVDWLHLFLLLLHIGTDQSTPFRAPFAPATAPSHLPQSQSWSWSRRQSQCFLCRSEWQLHFICSINLSQLDLSRDTYI